MEEEIKNLEYTLEKYNEVIEDSNLKLNHLKELFKFDYDAYLEEFNWESNHKNDKNGNSYVLKQSYNLHNYIEEDKK